MLLALLTTGISHHQWPIFVACLVPRSRCLTATWAEICITLPMHMDSWKQTTSTFLHLGTTAERTQVLHFFSVPFAYKWVSWLLEAFTKMQLSQNAHKWKQMKKEEMKKEDKAPLKEALPSFVHIFYRPLFSFKRISFWNWGKANVNESESGLRSDEQARSAIWTAPKDMVLNRSSTSTISIHWMHCPQV